ncbi:hypothetical protein EN845_29100 [Mesorhizobium sp. M8A.F.Ca.ET.202.01.1.1]|nr:hypothetical protein EN845_29100 [Mesorhizobium sp. M8A.F.Ca.ET.202.01.1.1]TGR19822.1 hypothetical protein EN840_28930 [Mesorhizobium sp. M8A.F.Ca.ET.197.01.1.1]TGR37738.1 hypothetical protein EN842_48970 [bacterium M00.F.Ca.ET.199.01.1.1]TGR43031.1 hypothetical protein EN841_28925 [Mesorhizobium sp. M8A.F.Ca.ET.198.01.1.1]TGU22720.1 hypothetical protein EN799_51525 [bacterium M00.F.Ca.ET.156.01.1.1]TGV82930.1 hypothetical protein EN792_028365 [Mesorhizobium sp. M00.F.Ca.ET.149.01.1.1]
MNHDRDEAQFSKARAGLVVLAPARKGGEEAGWVRLPISPLVGEMPGRAEGGAKERLPLRFVA